MPEPMEHLCIRIPLADLQASRDVAREEGLNLSTWVRLALRDRRKRWARTKAREGVGRG